MDTEELLVHDGPQGEAVEGVHAHVVHRLCVLDLAYMCVCVCECVSVCVCVCVRVSKCVRM